MTIQRLLPLLLFFPMALACAGENALFRAENSCVKYPTPDSRAECQKRQKEEAVAFEKEQKLTQQKQKAIEADEQKKDELCFTRKSTGDIVCPN